MLSCHEKGNHDVGDFTVIEHAAIAVLLLHEGSDHVVFMLYNCTLAVA